MTDERFKPDRLLLSDLLRLNEKNLIGPAKAGSVSTEDAEDTAGRPGIPETFDEPITVVASYTAETRKLRRAK